MQRMGWLRAGCLVLVFGGSLHAMGAQTDGAGEAQLKAAFVYNFARFVEWPAASFNDAGDRLQLCVAGQGPVARLLPELEGRTAQGRELQVRSISSTTEAKACHMIFVSGVGEPRVADVLQVARGLAVLTVSDVSGFADAGGVIGLVRVDDRLQFEINLIAARARGLKVSAHLLKLARTVKGDKP